VVWTNLRPWYSGTSATQCNTANPTTIEVIIKPGAGCTDRLSARAEQKALPLCQQNGVQNRIDRKQLRSDLVMVIGTYE